MSVYHYRAYNAAGQTIKGAIEADNLIAVEARLREIGAWLLDAHQGEAIEAEEISRLKIKGSELISFFVQMSLLLRAGITLPHSLDRLAKDFDGSRLGVVLATLKEKVSIGVPLNQAMSTYPRVFLPEVTSIIKAGEVSGRLPDVFESLSAYFEWLDRLVSDIRQALIYPLMVMGAATSLVIMLFTFIVPQFVVLLKDLKLKIPVLTQIVMVISDLLVHGWPVLILLLVGLPVGLKLARKNDSFATAFDRGLMRLPIFGSLIAMFALSRFTHNLAMLYRSGIPLLKGLEICRGLVGNRAIEHAIDEVHRGVSEGTPLSKCLTEHDVFPPTLVTMIASGETSGSLDFSLQSVSDYYNKMIPRRIKIVFSIFDPVMMVGLIGVVGCVALAVVLPILQLWDAK